MALHLITGGSGFVGNAIVQKLLNQGEQVRSIDPIPSQIRHPQLETIQGSILEPEVLKRGMQNVDIVHHVAAAVPLIQSPKAFQEINIRGTQMVVEAAIQNKVSHFNMLSSSAVYGKIRKGSCPLSENSPAQPFEDYGKSKLQAEQYAYARISKQTHTSIAVLRPRTIVGPGRMGIFDLLFNWIHTNNTIYLIGNGSNRLQLIHIEDLVDACLLAARKKQLGIFNIGAQEFLSLRESIQHLCEHAKSRSRIQSIPVRIAIPTLYALHKMHLSPFGPWHYGTFHRDYYFDTTNAEKNLGWKARYSNDEMLIEAYDWFSKNLNSIESKDSSVHQRSLKRGVLSLFMRTP